jgi:hypothetical protein
MGASAASDARGWQAVKTSRDSAAASVRRTKGRRDMVITQCMNTLS